MKILKDNGLTLALLAAFFISIVGMALAGWMDQNNALAEHGRPEISLVAYIAGGAFASGVFENWESEFLQMSAYVMLTAFLFQRGSAESRDPDKPSRDEGKRSFLYSCSLGLALAGLFAVSFCLHLWGSHAAAAEEAAWHGQPQPSLANYMADARFWFESFQNWQSEFLSTAVLVVLSIFLRFKGSPESKKVDDPNEKTGK